MKGEKEKGCLFHPGQRTNRLTLQPGESGQSPGMQLGAFDLRKALSPLWTFVTLSNGLLAMSLLPG